LEKFVNGLLVGVEGIDGCGKTSLIQAVAQLLSLQHITPVLTREPGGTKFGLQLRQILQYRDQIGNLDAKAEYLLFAADRAQHFTQVVIPNLQAGRLVISDRTGDSSLVYQGYGRGLDLKMLAQINSWATCLVIPNLIIYLRIDAQTAQARVRARAEKLTAFEQVEQAFFEKLINGFDAIYQNQEHVLILDGKLPTQLLAEQVVQKILLNLKN
jgi:dTMP kinase